MLFKNIHRFFPLFKLIKLLIFLSIGLQFIILTQIYFYKPESFSDPIFIINRIFRGVFLTFIAGVLMAYPDLFLIRYLNNKIPWKKGAGKRFILQFSFAIIVGLVITPIILIPAGVVFNLEYDTQTILNNVYYMIIMSIFLMIILEAGIYFDESSEEKNLNESLEEEIRKREQISLELKESREQLHSLLSNLIGAAYRCQFDEEYSMNYISEKIFPISGYPSTDFIKNKVRSYNSIIHPDDQELCRNTIAEAAERNAPFEMEYRIINASNEVVWVKENGQCIINDEGKVSYLDGIIIDITVRKKAELAVKESKRNYKDLMDFLPQPIFELDLEGNILYSNKAGDDFFGELPDDPQKKVSALDFFIKEDIPKIIENFRLSGQGIKTEPGEFTAIKKSGELCPVMVFGTPIYRNNVVVGRRGIIIDISERKKYELSLLKAKNDLELLNDTLEHNVAERTRQLTLANTQLLKVQKENLQSQFEVLKQQVNPHFLFNSLNVLTSLIKIDPDMAETFTERLSKVYRYVLENKEKDIVPLSTELEFLNAYLFLIEIRFMKKIIINIKIDKSYYEYQILPIAVQLIIENAIKHNTFSKLNPLKIEIFVDEQHSLNIVNNLNVRETKFVSTGVGLENISRRYALVSDLKPEFIKEKEHFVAKLPLLRAEKSETEKNY